jgi:hypothetical protein
MKRITIIQSALCSIVGLAALSLCLVSVQAGQTAALLTSPAPETSWQTTMRVLSGYEQAELNWSIPNGNQSPNILSELTWDDLEIWENQIQIEFAQPTSWHIRIAGSYGAILDGRNQDSDYLYSNRNGEFSRSYADVDGNTISASALIGYQFPYFGNRLTLTPSLGYQFDRQKMEESNGYQAVDLEYGYVGPFPGLDSSYQADWHTGILDLDSTFTLTDKLTLLAGTSFAMGDYCGEAVWNLRDDFQQDPSFRQEATAYRATARLGLRYQVTPCFAIDGVAMYKYSWTDDGSETNYFNSGPESNGFNGATWESLGFMLGAEIKF